MSFIKYIMDGVHFKLIIIDSTIAYVGSANLTGAGMGMKSPKKRNFEAGILTLLFRPDKINEYEESKQRNGCHLRF